jgi:PPM family protein phosphatase
VKEVEVKAGDFFLLCSDGLTGMLSDTDIRDRLSSGRSLHEICRSLINDSNARGGIDNVTVVLLSVEEDPAEAVDLSEVEIADVPGTEEEEDGEETR